MMEALRMGVGLIVAGLVLGGIAYIVRSTIRDRIPQDEIDAEARRDFGRWHPQI